MFIESFHRIYKFPDITVYIASPQKNFSCQFKNKFVQKNSLKPLPDGDLNFFWKIASDELEGWNSGQTKPQVISKQKTQSAARKLSWLYNSLYYVLAFYQAASNYRCGMPQVSPFRQLVWTLGQYVSAFFCTKKNMSLWNEISDLRRGKTLLTFYMLITFSNERRENKCNLLSPEKASCAC